MLYIWCQSVYRSFSTLFILWIRCMSMTNVGRGLFLSAAYEIKVMKNSLVAILAPTWRFSQEYLQLHLPVISCNTKTSDLAWIKGKRKGRKNYFIVKLWKADVWKVPCKTRWVWLANFIEKSNGLFSYKLR